jgi:hypothetical protein
MHIHDKFIVVDFNGDNPAVFTGSSNLAEGGEQANGDSLIMIEDAALASIYAIEALKIFDHYSFRDKMKTATDAQPLTLWYPGKPNMPQPWWTPAYDQNNIKFRDRCLFAAIALPGNLQSKKNVDWSSIVKPAPPAKAAGGGAKAPKKAPAGKAAPGKTAKPSPGKAAAKKPAKAAAAAKKTAKPTKKPTKKPAGKAATKPKTTAKTAAKKPAKKPTAKPAKKPAAKRAAPAKKSRKK